MTSSRRLLPLGASLTRGSFATDQIRNGFLTSFRGFATVTSSESEAALANLEAKYAVALPECSTLDEEITKIRREFELAKQRFLNIPEAINSMPKMNPQGIYVNKNLRLDNIQVYGFDYDYTLAHYSSHLQSLIYDLAKQHMVNEFRYPDACFQFKYDPTFPIRGLYYDKQKGCLMKLDFFGSIEPDGCYFGRRKLSRKEIESMYGTRHIGRDQARGLVGLMDFFCFSEACLIADMVQYFVDAKLEFDASNIYNDVNRAIQHVHRSGLVHRGILADPNRYLLKNGQLLRFLRMLKDKGKKLFLLTNSPYHFVDGGMRYLMEDSFGLRDSWRELFDVVIAKANKPEFYTSEHPFRCYDSERDNLAFTKVDAFDPKKVYYHGCLKSFLQITKWHGPEVIYFGDHLFSDLRGPSKAGWRTAAIIHELEREIQIQNGDSYRFEQAKFHIIQELLGRFHATVSDTHRSEACQSLLDELNNARQRARDTMKQMFNRSFGATFVTDTGQESAFSYHIHQYADVYTSKPENFLLYRPEAWLHVPYDIKIMPHHVKVASNLFGT
ncbi:PREDICTED: 5'-nucleotidase domain-containing protein DDB_G0275467-like isoform X2 [Camelina sativa]|uniref:5'-nucleotidase domain-containing protein DDB_G0275467-like isoform X2 n=1 Tax=Camelina sativa TaxID=90675 RepID=A0ABM0WKH2_CAMSA|nr:PREDICTED: 5'-nucleotidase domain-containing protein DDB_G0275467-like isoform X3 [Camelina sativa]XP_010472380.1 PREDICTED: 5'-nucleotidase domain-containing protein DDB_G0275467-like isoform X2 [Camelina sativa]